MRKIKISRKGASFGFAMAVIAVVILGAVGVFYFTSKNNFQKAIDEKPKTAEIKEQELMITQLKLCNSIDEDYNCVENFDGKYEPISFIDVLIRVEGLQSKLINGQYKTSYTQSREIIGPNNEIVESKIVLDKEDVVQDKGAYSLNMKNDIFLFDNAKPGQYEIKITVVDKNTGKSATKSKGFSVIWK